MLQNQEIKGFTLLELLVVLVLIGIISAVGYPSMSSWKNDRDVRSAAEKISLPTDKAEPKADIVVSPAPDTSNTSWG